MVRLMEVAPTPSVQYVSSPYCDFHLMEVELEKSFLTKSTPNQQW